MTRFTAAEGRAHLKAGRVETGHLSVESIIETYADRLTRAYPNDVAEFLEERDDLLAWYATVKPDLRLAEPYVPDSLAREAGRRLANLNRGGR